VAARKTTGRRITLRSQWQKLCDLVNRFKGKKVVVAGDLVLDRFWYGAVQRVSREAPVPIVKLSDTRMMPGCAANTVWNLAALGAETIPVGIVGQDVEGTALLSLLESAGSNTGRIIKLENYITPTKTRVLAGALHGAKQQLVRVDSGEADTFPDFAVSRIRSALSEALQDADALILSDYGYGLVKACGVEDFLASVQVTALDSRFAIKNFHGLTVATPNEEEFEEACEKPVRSDETLFRREGVSMREKLGLKALIVTRGKKGMTVFQESDRVTDVPVVGSDQVVDVTGAGDTVISTCVLALTSGADVLESANIANAAGGIVVQKHGTATTNPEELKNTLELWGRGRL